MKTIGDFKNTISTKILFVVCLLSVLIFPSCKKKADVTPASNPIQKPTADFTFTITGSGTLPAKVSFTNNSKNADNSKWYFGDGNTSLVANPENTYQSAKTYDVKLVVTNSGGKDSVTKQVQIVLDKPKADFTYTIANDGSMPCKVSFQNTSFRGQTFKWSFGDGQTSIVENTDNTYSSSKTFDVKLVVNNSTGKDSVIKQIKISKIKYSVRIFLITPTDKPFNQKYYDALKMCALNLQSWYKQQMGGKTFVLNNPIIDTLKGMHTYNWYNQYNGTYSGTDTRYYGYYNTLYEVQQVIGNDLNTDLYMNAVYVAAPGGGAGSKGFCALGDQDLDGLLGINPTDGNVNRWIGGSGHEWGHGFGLPHPPGQEPQALMWTGYTIYPNCILQQADKDILNAGSFFK